MKKLSFLMASAIAVFAAVSCGGGAKEEAAFLKPDSPEMTLMNSVGLTVDSLMTIVKGDSLTETEFKALMLANTKVKFDSAEYRMCDYVTVETAEKIFRQHPRPANFNEFATEVLQCGNDQVVAGTIYTIGKVFYDDDLSLVPQVIEAAKTGNYSKYAAIEVLANVEMPEVSAFMKSVSSEKDEVILKKLANELNGKWAFADETVAIEVAKVLLLSDLSNVQETAAFKGCDLDRDELLPIFEEVLSKQCKGTVHMYVLNGLKAMWYGRYNADKNNPKAYEIALNYFKKTPRSEEMPAFSTVGTFFEVKDEEWMSSSEYFDKAEIVKVMKDVALDVNAGWLVRVDAVKVINQFEPSAVSEVKSAIQAKESNSKTDLIINAINKL